MTLSGGMKGGLIAKALSHEPQILFLDEPTAASDVELRRTCGTSCSALRAEGVTINTDHATISKRPKNGRSYRRDAQGKIILVEDRSR